MRVGEMRERDGEEGKKPARHAKDESAAVKSFPSPPKSC